MQGNINIREFERDDAKDIIRLHSEETEHFEEIELTEEFILSISYRSDFRFFVADINGRLVGFVGALFHKNVRRGEIGPICVDYPHKRRGLGKKLLDHTLNYLETEGIHRIIVKVKSKNTSGIKFFKSSGFEEEAYMRDYTKDGEDVIQLLKFLNP